MVVLIDYYFYKNIYRIKLAILEYVYKKKKLQYGENSDIIIHIIFTS